MDTTINNNQAFKANIKTLVKPENKEAFKKICSEFGRRTSKYPNDALYITGTKSRAYSWHITDKKRGDFYKGEEIFTTSIDNHIEELGIKKFTKELINVFNAMKYERIIYKKAKPLKIAVDKTRGLVNAYENIAKAYKNDGNMVMAKRYEYLAQRNTEKLNKLNRELNEYKNKFNTRIRELSIEFPEIGQIELYIA